MSNSENSGCLLGIVMVVINLAAWLGTGAMAWNWIEPDSFFGAVKFLFLWGFFGYIAQIVGGLIIAGIASVIE